MKLGRLEHLENPHVFFPESNVVLFSWSFIFDNKKNRMVQGQANRVVRDSYHIIFG